MHDNRDRSLQRKDCHEGGDDHIRPSGAGSEYAERGEQHGEIAEHVVARANRPRTGHLIIISGIVILDTELGIGGLFGGCV